MADEKNQSVLGKLAAQNSGEQKPTTETTSTGPVDTGTDEKQTAPIIENDGSVSGTIYTSDKANITPAALVESDQGSVGKATVRTSKERRILPMSEEEALKAEQSENAAPTPVAAYKHRTVRHFKVGEFEFKNHVLYLYTNDGNERFLDLFETLTPRDQSDIVVYDFEAAKRVETPVAVSRGSMSTSSLKDPKVVQG